MQTIPTTLKYISIKIYIMQHFFMLFSGKGIRQV